MRLPEPPVDDRPDNFWNWRVLDIDEQRWEENERVRQQEHGSWWPFIVGGIVGLLIAVLTA